MRRTNRKTPDFDGNKIKRLSKATTTSAHWFVKRTYAVRAVVLQTILTDRRQLHHYDDVDDRDSPSFFFFFFSLSDSIHYPRAISTLQLCSICIYYATKSEQILLVIISTIAHKLIFTILRRRVIHSRCVIF